MTETVSNVRDLPFTQLTKAERRATLYRAQGGRCWYCDCVMTIIPPEPRHLPPPPNFGTFEHITPVRRNSKTHKIRPNTPVFLLSESNLVLVCQACNSRRGDQPLTAFIDYLRQSGKSFGIVSRIRHLVNDHIPTPKQASEFEWYMLQTLAHPRRPDDALKRLPQDLEAPLLPDPSQPIPLAEIIARHVLPMPKRKPILVRVVNWLCRTARQYRNA
jgi:hypothetical protein